MCSGQRKRYLTSIMKDKADPNHNHNLVFKAANEAVKDSKLTIVEEYLDVAQKVSKII